MSFTGQTSIKPRVQPSWPRNEGEGWILKYPVYLFLILAITTRRCRRYTRYHQIECLTNSSIWPHFDLDGIIFPWKFNEGKIRREKMNTGSFFQNIIRTIHKNIVEAQNCQKLWTIPASEFMAFEHRHWASPCNLYIYNFRIYRRNTKNTEPRPTFTGSLK